MLYRGNLYGMQLMNAIQKAGKGRRDIGFGSLYPTLTRMEKKGLVSWYWGDEQSGPRRKYYEITPFGKQALEEDCQFHEELSAIVEELLATVDVASEDAGVQTAAKLDEKTLIPTQSDG